MKEVEKIKEQSIFNNVFGFMSDAVATVIKQVSPDKITFLENRIPELLPGDYKLTATQMLAKLETKSFESSLTIRVATPKLKLNPQDIYNIYPPKNSLDDYHTILPHIVLNNSLLPWSIEMEIDGKKKKDLPWLALVIVKTDEIKHDGKVNNKITFPSAALFGKKQEKLTEENTKPIVKLTSAFKKWNNKVQGGAGNDNLDDIEERALLICSQFPEPNCEYEAHVISLHHIDFKDDNITTFSLFNWQFQTNTSKVSFNGTLDKTTKQLLKLPEVKGIDANYVIPRLSNLSMEDATFLKEKKVNLKAEVTKILGDAKEEGLQRVFLEYLQIALKDLIIRIFDRAVDGQFIRDELIKKAYWIVIQAIIDKDLLKVTTKGTAETILKLFNLYVARKAKTVKVEMFKLKFRSTLLLYLSNDKKLTDTYLASITSVNINKLKIGNLKADGQKLKETTDYKKLVEIFNQDKAYVDELFAANQKQIEARFKAIVNNSDFEKQCELIKSKVADLETASQFNHWVDEILEALKEEINKEHRLRPLKEKSLNDILEDALVRNMKHLNIKELLDVGFVPLPHFMRRGSRVVSLYRSPFLPTVCDAGQNFKAIHYPDELYRFFGFAQMLDATYAAAWELGRMLTLENEQVATTIYKWKRQYILEGKSVIQLDPFGIINPPSNILNKSAFERTIKPWIKELMEFKNIPFGYLVPYEDMLPPESMRFFNVDKSWQAALLDGVLSVGRIFDTEGEDTRKLNWSRFKVKSEKNLGSGVLIRSRVISDYPDIIVIANDTIRPKYMRRLSDDILLSYFEVPVKKMEIFLKAMGMRFGLNETYKTTEQVTALLKSDKKAHEVAAAIYKKSPKSTITKI